jgi:hypothetical protein
MADNVGFTPGVGATAAADEIGGVLYQRIKLSVGDQGGDSGDASPTNPVPTAVYGELIEAIESMRIAIQSLTRTVGLQTVDAFGRNRVVLDALGGSQTLGALTTVGTLTTLTNQAQLGGLATQDQIPSLMHLQADNLRSNITVS